MPRKKITEEVVETTQNNDVAVKEVGKTNKTNKIKGVVISKGGLRIRKEESLESEIIDVLPYNTEIEILEELEEWVKVKQGYMFKKFIKINN